MESRIVKAALLGGGVIVTAFGIIFIWGVSTFIGLVLILIGAAMAAVSVTERTQPAMPTRDSVKQLILDVMNDQGITNAAFVDGDTIASLIVAILKKLEVEDSGIMGGSHIKIDPLNEQVIRDTVRTYLNR